MNGEISSGSVHGKDWNPLSDLLQRDASKLTEYLSEHGHQMSSAQLNDALQHGALRGLFGCCAALLAAGAHADHYEEESQPRQTNNKMFRREGYSCQGARDYTSPTHYATRYATPLHKAAQNGHVDVVKLLLEYGARPLALDRNGFTPLMLSCMETSNTSTALLLLPSTMEALVEADQRFGCTALHYAAWLKDPVIVEALVRAGANIEARDLEGNTPLMLACSLLKKRKRQYNELEYVTCARVLLAAGAQIETINKNCGGALLRALEAQCAPLVKLLLEYDAIVQSDVFRYTCLILKHREICQLLLTRVFDEELMVATLAELIYSQYSKWMLSNITEQNDTHDIARLILKRLPDVNVIQRVAKRRAGLHFRSYAPCDGESITLPELDKHVWADIAEQGLFTFALYNGRLGIARMLHVSGIRRPNLNSLKKSRSMVALKHCGEVNVWLTTCMCSPLSLKLLSRYVLRKHLVARIEDSLNELFGLTPDLINFILMNDLDDVTAVDRTVLADKELLLDTSYEDREKSKAAVTQMLWIYSN